MDDLISRQAVIEAFGLSEKTRKYGGDHSGYDTRMLYEIQDTLESLPSAQPEHGRWIDKYGDGDWHCTRCGAIVEKHEQDYRNWYFCYHCGAKMDEVSE